MYEACFELVKCVGLNVSSPELDHHWELFFILKRALELGGFRSMPTAQLCGNTCGRTGR